MPTTFTSNLGIAKPGNGEQDGVWGSLVNTNMDILDRAVNGVLGLTLSGISSTLTTTDGTFAGNDGLYKVLSLQGSPSGTHTITIAPNDAQKVYLVYNTTAQSVVFTQGSGGNVTVAAGDSAIIYCNGVGPGSAVTNLTDHFAMNSVKITGGAISGATLSTSSATVTGGTINSTSVGATTPSTGAFTTLSASSTTTLSGTTVLSGQVGLNGANYGTAGQVMTSQGAGVAPTWVNSFPTGGIILWSGSIASVPAGWALCNGANGTPDLRDRFVVGAGSTYAVNATGGANTVTLSAAEIPAHTHTVSGTTSTTGSHSHVTNVSFSPDVDYFGNLVSILNAGQYGANSVSGQSINLSSEAAGDHAHTFSGTTSSVGSGGAHENRPPYYALAYIMKL